MLALVEVELVEDEQRLLERRDSCPLTFGGGGDRLLVI